MAIILVNEIFIFILVDSEVITVHYPNIQSILMDLRSMGGSNALLIRSGGFPRIILDNLNTFYNQDFKTDHGYLPLTFCIIYFMAWT